MSRTVHKSILIKRDIDRVFRTLITPSEIITWWNANQVIVKSEKDGLMTIRWGDNVNQPDYLGISKIE